MTQALSFDIGKKNFAFLLEEFDEEKMSQTKNTPLNKRYNPNGTCTIEFERILEEIFKNGTKILLKNIDLTHETKTDKYFDTDILYNLFEVLNERKIFFEKVSVVIIEKQMSFKGKINTMALIIAAATMSWFMIHFGRSLQVIEFPHSIRVRF